MTNERASKRQQELLSFVDGFIKEHGYGPSYREIMTALGYKSVSTVAIHIENLITKGYLSRRDKSARSLEVVTTQHDMTTVKEVSISHEYVQNELQKKLRAAELTDEQRDSIINALELLGFTISKQQDEVHAAKT